MIAAIGISPPCPVASHQSLPIMAYSSPLISHSWTCSIRRQYRLCFDIDKNDISIPRDVDLLWSYLFDLHNESELESKKVWHLIVLLDCFIGADCFISALDWNNFIWAIAPDELGAFTKMRRNFNSMARRACYASFYAESLEQAITHDFRYPYRRVIWWYTNPMGKVLENHKKPCQACEFYKAGDVSICGTSNSFLRVSSALPRVSIV